MFAFLAIALLLITAVAILFTRFWRPASGRLRFGRLSLSRVSSGGAGTRRTGIGLAWMAAALGSLAAWSLALAAWRQAPRSFTPLNWQKVTLIPASPAFILDSVSWAFLLAVISLNLAVVLADVHRIAPDNRSRASRVDLAAGLFLTALGAAAVMADNLLTLLLLWCALDLAQLVTWIVRARSGQDIENAVIALTVRLASYVVVLWGWLSASHAGISTNLTPVSAQFSPYLIAAAGLRLGLLPPHRPVPEGETLAPGLNTLAWLVPGAAALAPLERAASAGRPAGSTWFLLFGAGAILYAGWSWINTRSARAGLPFYLLGYSALALAGAARGLPFAGMAWGLAGLLAGGLMALLGPRTRGAALPLLIGGLFSAGLPFTPTWPGVGLFAWPFPPLTVLYLAGLGLLLAGFVRQAIRRTPSPPTAERWVWLIYPLGLAVLPAAFAIIAVALRPGSRGGLQSLPGALASGLSLIAVGVAVFTVAILQQRRSKTRRNAAARRNERLAPALELNWAYRAVWSIYKTAGSAATQLGWALEGRAGLLWALLALTLLLSLLAQIGLGG